MKYLLFCSLLLTSLMSYSQDRILVDGLFDEWEQYPISYTDATGDGGFLGTDFGRVQIYNDADFIFFSLETGIEINLQDANEITMYLDTDNDSNTGFSINGIGAELVYNLGNRSGRFFQSGSSFDLFHDDIGLVNAPTVTSDRFELAVKRDIMIAGNPLFQSNDLKIVFLDNIPNGDILPDLNETLAYSFSTNNLGPLPAYSIQKNQDSDIRIMTYNVLSNSLFEQSLVPSYTRIFQATQPDIIGFQEIDDFSSQQVANQMESILPSDIGQQWYHAKEGPDCHAISRYPILESALIPGYNQSAGNGAFLIEVPGIETNLLLIVAHLPCCTNNSGRQIEVDLIMEFLREAKNGNGPIPIATNTPIVIVGDMNLVGDNRQLETMISGDILDEASYGPDFNPDWDGNNFLDSHPYATGVPFSYTWYRPQSSFSPGRLDYIIYSGSNLSLQNSYALFTPGLSQERLNTFNLFPADVLVASDHLPTVVDFELKNLTAQNNLPSNPDLGILSIYPNPTHGRTEASFKLDQADQVMIELIHQTGKSTPIFYEENVNQGEHQFQFDTSTIPTGMYLLRITTSKFSDTKKFIISDK